MKRTIEYNNAGVACQEAGHTKEAWVSLCRDDSGFDYLRSSAVASRSKILAFCGGDESSVSVKKFHTSSDRLTCLFLIDIGL